MSICQCDLRPQSAVPSLTSVGISLMITNLSDISGSNRVLTLVSRRNETIVTVTSYKSTFAYSFHFRTKTRIVTIALFLSRIEEAGIGDRNVCLIHREDDDCYDVVFIIRWMSTMMREERDLKRWEDRRQKQIWTRRKAGQFCYRCQSVETATETVWIVFAEWSSWPLGTSWPLGCCVAFWCVMLLKQNIII